MLSWSKRIGHIGDFSSATNDYSHFIKNTFGTEDGSTGIGYSTDMTKYIDTLCILSQINKFIRAKKFINTVTDGNGKTYKIANSLVSRSSLSGTSGSGSYYCDYFYQPNGNTYALHGGATTSGPYCGTFFVNLAGVASRNIWYIGAALSFKPVT